MDLPRISQAKNALVHAACPERQQAAAKTATLIFTAFK
jgi:hypothetical protein